MARLLFKKGKARILSDNLGKLSASKMNNLIKIAGTTCYQTREVSKKTPAEFIQMLQKSGHFAMLEHSWQIIEIFRTGYMVEQDLTELEFRRANSLFCITERPDSLLISGNARMFNEAGVKSKGHRVLSVLSLLNKRNPVLFPLNDKNKSDSCKSNIGLKPVLETKKEKLIHRAMTVEFNNCCRGMTHETVRSRSGDEKITSYAQESTRYVDYAKGDLNLAEFQMKFILPYNDKFDFKGKKIDFLVGGQNYSFTAQEFTNLIEGWYRALRNNDLRPEEARQWLPIGIKSQIVQTYNLNEWRHWFFLRTGIRAHPEIRFVAVGLLKEMQKRVPECFDDFEISRDGESAVYKGGDELV